MSTINLDAATLAKFRNLTGPVTLCDENGAPVVERFILSALPLDREPDLTEEEWDAIANEPGEMTTSEVLAHLQSLEKS